MAEKRKWEHFRIGFDISTDVNAAAYLFEIMREQQEQLAERLKKEGFRSLIYFDAFVEKGRDPDDDYEAP